MPEMTVTKTLSPELRVRAAVYTEIGCWREILTRREALDFRLSVYFPAIPCAHGHMTLRLTRTDECLACLKAGKGTGDDFGAE